MSASILSPSEVLSLYDDDMFDEAEEAAAAAAAAGGGGGGGAGGGYSAAAPHGAAHASLEEAAGHARVASHPLWPVLVELYFACRKVGGADAETAAAVAAERQELAARVEAARVSTRNGDRLTTSDLHAAAPAQANAAAPQPPHEEDPELDAFLTDYVNELQTLKAELEDFMSTTDDICASFERRLCEISPAFATSVATNGGGANGSASRTLVVRHPAPSSRGGKNGAGGVAMPVNGAAVQSCAIAQAASGSLLAQAAAEAGLPPNAPLSAAAAEALLRGHLKKRHAACILSLREEFQRKRKKGKLPGDATSALKAFWALHIDWPYPGEEDKAELADKTGLNATQINNWFINQRKRHWHKLFDGSPPGNQEASHKSIIAKYGSLKAGMAAMGR